MKKLLLVAALVLTGCASPVLPPPPSDTDMIDSKLPVRCSSKEQCDRWWRAAQVWVVKNSGYKVQIATDAILQTYNASSGRAAYSVEVTRSPEENDVDLIEIEARCGWAGHCDPVYETFIADFKRFIIGTK